MMTAFWLLVGRDLRLKLRQSGDSAVQGAPEAFPPPAGGP